MHDVAGIALALNQPRWQLIFTIPAGTVLTRGRGGPYGEIVAAAHTVTDRFGCYSWQADGNIFYCGSFQDYAKHKTNLAGRIAQYLVNHR